MSCWHLYLDLLIWWDVSLCVVRRGVLFASGLNLQQALLQGLDERLVVVMMGLFELDFDQQLVILFGGISKHFGLGSEFQSRGEGLHQRRKDTRHTQAHNHRALGGEWDTGRRTQKRHDAATGCEQHRWYDHTQGHLVVVVCRTYIHSAILLDLTMNLLKKQRVAGFGVVVHVWGCVSVCVVSFSSSRAYLFFLYLCAFVCSLAVGLSS